MYSYKTIVGRTISIICNLLTLFFGGLLVYTIFSQNSRPSVNVINATVGYILGVVIGVVVLGCVILGFISIFTEMPIVVLNFVGTIAGVIMAVLLLFGASKEPSGSFNMILYSSGAGLLLIYPVGTGFIVSAEGRDIG